MIAMRPIDEQDVVVLLNDGRFDGDIQGYVMMQDEEYMGYALYRIQDDIVEVLDSNVAEKQSFDGIVRACVAAGQNKGAKSFGVNMENNELREWWNIFCKDVVPPRNIDTVFELCVDVQ